MPSRLQICPECFGEGLCSVCSGEGCPLCAYTGDCELCGGTHYLQESNALRNLLLHHRHHTHLRRTLAQLCTALRTPRETREHVLTLLDTLGPPHTILPGAHGRIALIWQHQGLELEIELG